MSGRSDAVTKVRALIERAAHPSTPEEEARTSAFIAVKLIKANGLEIGDKTEPSRNGAEPPAQRRPSPADPFRRPQPSPADPFRRPAPSPPPPSRPPRRRPSNVSWVLIVSAYRSQCKSCRRFYEQGEEVCWQRGKGATHYDCRDYWDEGDGGL